MIRIVRCIGLFYPICSDIHPLDVNAWIVVYWVYPSPLGGGVRNIMGAVSKIMRNLWKTTIRSED